MLQFSPFHFTRFYIVKLWEIAIFSLRTNKSCTLPMTLGLRLRFRLPPWLSVSSSEAVLVGGIGIPVIIDLELRLSELGEWDSLTILPISIPGGIGKAPGRCGGGLGPFLLTGSPLAPEAGFWAGCLWWLGPLGWSRWSWAGLEGWLRGSESSELTMTDDPSDRFCCFCLISSRAFLFFIISVNNEVDCKFDCCRDSRRSLSGYSRSRSLRPGLGGL